MEIVEVIWIDACVEEAKVPLSTALDLQPIKRRNVGYLLPKDDGNVIIAYGVLENLFKGQTAYEYSFEIPKGMIQKVRKLK